MLELLGLLGRVGRALGHAIGHAIGALGTLMVTLAIA